MKSRYVMVELDETIKHIQVKNIQNNLLRTIDLTNVKELTVRHLKDFKQLIIKVANHYDLVSKRDSKVKVLAPSLCGQL